MYRIIHNNREGFRATFEEAEQAVRDRLRAVRGKGYQLLCSGCDVNAQGLERVAAAYYSPQDGKYDLIVIEKMGEEDGRDQKTLEQPEHP